MKIGSIAFEIILWGVQLLLLAVIAVCVVVWHKAEVAMILPEMIIPWLFGAYLLMVVVCRLWLKERVSLFVLVNAFVPWVPFHWGLFPFEEYVGKTWMQLLFYIIAQAIWIWATNPIWTGRLIERIRYRGK